MTLINPCAGCRCAEALPLTDLCRGCEDIFAADWNERVTQQNRPGSHRFTAVVLQVRDEEAA